jgi:thioredoxin reductase (NADPH)
LTEPKIIFSPFEEAEQVYDAIVVGAGPAGLATALYLARANRKVLILEAEKPGGRLLEAKLIENYPGFSSISGQELAQKMVRQASEAGAKMLSPARAVRFELSGEPKVVWTRDKDYRAKAIVIAIGVQRKRVEIQGARERLGIGVSYCPVCDGTLFRQKDVALIGEDQETISDGLYLSDIVNKIHFVPGSLTPHYKQEDLDKLLAKGKTQVWQTYQAVEITGSGVVEGIRIMDLNTEQEQILSVKGVFISGEKTPITEMLAAAGVKTDPLGCIITDEQTQTNVQNVYAAGDATCGRKYQIAVSVGQGVTAALNIIRKR